MSIANRIRYFRCRLGLTQKALGMLMGFSEQTAHVRICQYESGSIQPSRKRIDELAQIFRVSADAIQTPELETIAGLMHTLFLLEELYGFRFSETGSGFRLELPCPSDPALDSALRGWVEQKKLLENQLITQSEYGYWKYTFTTPEHQKADDDQKS